jgi:DivIVA domain-containing protein
MTQPFRSDETRLTLADVEAATFPRTPVMRRGYDEAAVDEFLARVSRELAMLATEKAGLVREVMRLRERFVSRDGAVPVDDSEARALAVTIVSEAQVTADGYVQSAREYSGRLREDALRQRETLLEEADRERQRIRLEAEVQARQAAAAALEVPVPARAGEPLRAARAQAAWTSAFGGVYLAHIRVMIEAIMRILEDWEQKERETPSAQESRRRAGTAVPSEWHSG